MQAIAVAARIASGVNWYIGQVFSWLAVAIVAVCFTVVVQRYVFSVSYLWLQDLYVWLNGAMFTAVAGFAFLRNDHVRLDIFYARASLRTKAIVDLACTLVFLFPFSYVVVAWGWTFVARSWRFGEGSANIGGLPGLFVLKSFIIAFAVLIALEGLAIALRSVLVLQGREDLLPTSLRYHEGDLMPDFSFLAEKKDD